MWEAGIKNWDLLIRHILSKCTFFIFTALLCFTCWTMIHSLRFSYKIIIWKWDKNKAKEREMLIWNFVINSEILTLLVKISASTFSWELSRTVINTQNLILGMHCKLLPKKSLTTTTLTKKPQKNISSHTPPHPCNSPRMDFADLKLEHLRI